MKYLLSTLLVGIAILISYGIEAQDLQIFNSTKTLTFKTGTLIKVDVPPREGLECNPCQHSFLIGRIISYKNDTLTLRILFENEPIMTENKEIGFQLRNYYQKKEEDWPVIEIPRNNIYTITKQGTKKWSSANGGDILGAGLLTFGVINLYAAIVTNGSTDALVGSGVTLTILGLIMVGSFDRITYHIENSPNMKPKDKSWNIR